MTANSKQIEPLTALEVHKYFNRVGEALTKATGNKRAGEAMTNLHFLGLALQHGLTADLGMKELAKARRALERFIEETFPTNTPAGGATP